MEYRYPTEQEKHRRAAVQEYHDKARDKGLLQNMHEDRLSWKQFKAKLRREHRAALHAIIRQDKAWWQDGRPYGPYGLGCTLHVEGKWNPTMYDTQTGERYPIAEYWYRALGIPLP